MSRIEVVVSDFGGVLTSPLIDAFVAVQNDTGVSVDQFAKAMSLVKEREDKHPLFELECGRISEASFLEKLEIALQEVYGDHVPLHGFSNSYFDALHPNRVMIDLMHTLKDAGYRMAMLTNNVKEWEPLWKAKLPVDDIFELIVDSAFVGVRKPDPAIYRLLLERLGGIDASSCIFIDDVEVNCKAAQELGMAAVHFRDTDQAVTDIGKELGQSFET